MDAETKAHIHAAEATDEILNDIAHILAGSEDDARADFGRMARIGLDSSDRLTVTRTQAQLLLWLCDLLNGGDA